MRVYHTYKDNEYDQKSTYWFTTNEEDEDLDHFDVRKLPTWIDQLPPFIHNHTDPMPKGYEHNSPELRARWDKYYEEEPALIKKAICEAIDFSMLENHNSCQEDDGVEEDEVA